MFPMTEKPYAAYLRGKRKELDRMIADMVEGLEWDCAQEQERQEREQERARPNPVGPADAGLPAGGVRGEGVDS